MTHLLETRRQQRPVPRPNPLRNNSSPITRPWTLHLHEHPLIRSHFPRLMEVDTMIQADLHPHLRPVLPLLETQTIRPAGVILHSFALVSWQVGHRGGSPGEAPEPVDAGDGADEVAVGHVGQGIEVRAMTTRGRDLPLCTCPRPAFPLPNLLTITITHFNPPANNRRPFPLPVLPIIARLTPRHPLRQLLRVTDLLFIPVRPIPHETDCSREDATALLPCLDGTSGEGAAVTDTLDVVEDGDGGVSCEEEVAVA